MTRRQALLLVVALNLLKGQQGETTKPVEPDSLGPVYYLNPSDHTIKALPKEQWNAFAKAKMGFQSSKAIGSIRLPGVSSSFRVPASDTTEFVFKVGSPESVKLFGCTQNTRKQFRQADIREVQNKFVPFKGPTSTEQRLPGIATKITKYGESSYKLSAERLAPGEYAIVNGDDVFSFAIQ
jgi:hypothetical protein